MVGWRLGGLCALPQWDTVSHRLGIGRYLPPTTYLGSSTYLHDLPDRLPISPLLPDLYNLQSTYPVCEGASTDGGSGSNTRWVSLAISSSPRPVRPVTGSPVIHCPADFVRLLVVARQPGPVRPHQYVLHVRVRK